MQTFGTTAATHLGEESATQSGPAAPAAETTHPHEESQPTAKKGAKQLRSAQQLPYEDVEYSEEEANTPALSPGHTGVLQAQSDRAHIVTHMHSNLITKFGLIW